MSPEFFVVCRHWNHSVNASANRTQASPGTCAFYVRWVCDHFELKGYFCDVGERKAVRAESLDDFRGMLSFTKGGELFPSLEFESFSAITATISDEASFGEIFVIICWGKRHAWDTYTQEHVLFLKNLDWSEWEAKSRTQYYYPICRHETCSFRISRTFTNLLIGSCCLK